MAIVRNRTKRKVIGLTLFLFALGYFLIVKAGISDVRHLFSILVATYLVAWGGYSLISLLPRDEIRSQFVLMTLSIGVALMLAEMPAWLKLIDYRKPFSISSVSPWDRPGYLPDSELLAKPEPHHVIKVLFDQGNIGKALCLPPRQVAPFELRYDKNGFRNEQDLSSAEIAIIGDSYVESPMISGSMLATTLLAKIVRKTVANLGQSGYGPQQELIVLKRYALPLHPQSVVWVFFEGNDLSDASHYEEKVSSLVSTRNSIDTVWDRSFTKNSLFWLIRFLQGCVPNRGVEGNIATVLDDEGREHRMYFGERSTAASLTTRQIDALQKSVAAIEEAYRVVQKEGAQFIVVLAPTKFRVYRDIANFERLERILNCGSSMICRIVSARCYLKSLQTSAFLTSRPHSNLRQERTAWYSYPMIRTGQAKGIGWWRRLLPEPSRSGLNCMLKNNRQNHVRRRKTSSYPKTR